jgi:methanethiol oxidase
MPRRTYFHASGSRDGQGHPASATWLPRRDFLKASAMAGLALQTTGSCWGSEQHDHAESCGLTYASPTEAMAAPPETLAYCPAIYVGTPVAKPDYLATIDVNPQSERYGQVVHRLPMPNVGDELHHFGWNACSSCHGDEAHQRRFLVLPGLASSNIHIVDVARPDTPALHKVIPGEEVKRQTNLSAPHTVHCLADGTIILSMLGDAEGNAPGGFLHLSDRFDILGRWERDLSGMNFNYDFWYQPRHNVMVSSEWAAPNTVRPGFQLEDVRAGKYGRHLHFWDWSQRKITQTIDLGEQGMIPLEVRFHHDPTSSHGFVGAALSSTMWHWHRAEEAWRAEPVIRVEPVEVDGWPFPVPGLITDLVLSLDDRWLYFSNWLHGDIRQYDVSDPSKPRLAGRIWLGGLIGRRPDTELPLVGGPQMLQLSLDGRRLYVTNSLYSSWDNQFYPKMAERGSHMLKLDCDTTRGGLTLDERFFVDFGREPEGPARAHEIRFPNGDSTSDIWM